MTLALIAIAVLYSLGWYRLWRALPGSVSGMRFAAFMAGIAGLWLVVGSPLAELDHHLLTAHMVQHLVIMVVAAPLILLGAPSITLLYGLPRRFVRHVLEPLLRWHPVQHLGRVCAHPAFCWLAGTITVMAWHVPAVFDLAQRSHHWHEVEHACFLTAGLLFWWPVIQPWPSVAGSPPWSIPLYLFLATLPCDALSAFLTFCDHVVYRPYLSAHGVFHLDPLQDQALAGALMWVSVTFAYLIPAVAVMIQILSGPRRRTSDVEVF